MRMSPRDRGNAIRAAHIILVAHFAILKLPGPRGSPQGKALISFLRLVLYNTLASPLEPPGG